MSIVSMYPSRLRYLGDYLAEKHWFQPRYRWIYWLLFGIIIGYFLHTPVRYARVAWSMYWRAHHHQHAYSKHAGDQKGECKCTAGVCPTVDPEVFSESSGQFQMFVNMTMPCDGEIVAWKYLQEEPVVADRSVHILVGRGENDHLFLDGINTIMTTEKSGWVEFPVDAAKRISVTQNNFIAIVYDSISDRPVIPYVDARSPKRSLLKQRLSDGIEVEVDRGQIEDIMEIGQASPMAISTFMSSRGLQLQSEWRLPALQAIIE